MNAGLRCQLRNNRFRDLGKQLRAQEREARTRAANVGASVARQLAPVDTGLLRSLIEVRFGANGGVRLVSGADYSAHVNFGTVFHAPNPFFSKAVEAMKKQLPKEYRRMRLR
jgi:HK97 gp10 family phage protein